VKIWTNPWINTKGPTRPITPRGQKLVTEVCVLLDPITGNWDEQLVRNTFWEMDSKVILVTPIRDEFEDFLCLATRAEKFLFGEVCLQPIHPFKRWYK
jgi:hypothetical protein